MIVVYFLACFIAIIVAAIKFGAAAVVVFFLCSGAGMLAVLYFSRYTLAGYVPRHLFVAVISAALMLAMIYYHHEPAAIGSAFGLFIAIFMEYLTRTAPELPNHP